MKIISAVRWIARIASLLLALFLILIGLVVGRGGKETSTTDMIALVFILCLISGLVLSWPKEKYGIILVFIGIIGLVAVTTNVSSKDPLWLLLLASPTTLLVFCRIAETRVKKAET